MYAALWRVLPGPRWAKAVQCLALALVACWALLTFAFPQVEPVLPFDEILISR